MSSNDNDKEEGSARPSLFDRNMEREQSGDDDNLDPSEPISVVMPGHIERMIDDNKDLNCANQEEDDQDEDSEEDENDVSLSQLATKNREGEVAFTSDLAFDDDDEVPLALLSARRRARKRASTRTRKTEETSNAGHNDLTQNKVIEEPSQDDPKSRDDQDVKKRTVDVFEDAIVEADGGNKIDKKDDEEDGDIADGGKKIDKKDDEEDGDNADGGSTIDKNDDEEDGDNADGGSTIDKNDDEEDGDNVDGGSTIDKNDDEEDGDADDSMSEDSERRQRVAHQQVRKSGRKRKRRHDTDDADGMKTKARAGPRGPLTERTCPHCSRVFTIKDGLQYHIDHYVCRPALNPNPEIKKKGGRKKRAPGEEGGKPGKSPKLRGSLDKRTCPKCKRVFTSVLGLTYHLEHGVCEQKLPQPFATLNPGSRFITAFGVVEVLADNRAVPTASFPADLRIQTRRWNSFKAKRDVQINKVWVAAAVLQRIRRYRLAALYNSNSGVNNNSNHINISEGVTQYAVWKIYFGGNPTRIPRSAWKVPAVAGPLLPDPAFPNESYPERIVECVLIPDQRKKLFGLEEEDASMADDAIVGQSVRMEQGPLSTGRDRTARLYLQRKLLTEPYKPDVVVWSCPNCGGYFNSRPGIKFHIDSQVCKKAKARVVAARECLKVIEERARRQPIKPIQAKKVWKPKRKKEDSMYPQVWLSLGFRLLPKIPTQLLYPPVKQDEEPPEPVVAVEPPEHVLRGLRAQLQFVSMVQNVSLGPMYPEVYKSLGYKKPRKRKRKKFADDEEQGGGDAGAVVDDGVLRYRPRRRQRTTAVKPPPPPKPLPPIIDVRALADEVDAGRYPSVKRYKGDEHEEQCYLCKEGGTLFCCDFCNKAIHMNCLTETFTVKVPEPEDDFMCHRCIRKILQRRARAEQRRIRKQEMKKAMASKQGEIPEEMKGMEYEYLASQGREVSELVELLQDAQTRLRMALETEKVNDIRRGFIDSCENVETTEATTTTMTSNNNTTETQPEEIEDDDEGYQWSEIV